jgi:hypothetical protein
MRTTVDVRKRERHPSRKHLFPLGSVTHLARPVTCCWFLQLSDSTPSHHPQRLRNSSFQPASRLKSLSPLFEFPFPRNNHTMSEEKQTPDASPSHREVGLGPRPDSHHFIISNDDASPRGFHDTRVIVRQIARRMESDGTARLAGLDLTMWYDGTHYLRFTMPCSRFRPRMNRS